MVKPKQINLIPREILQEPLLIRVFSVLNKHKKARNIILLFSIIAVYTISQIMKTDVLKWRVAEAKRQAQSAKVKLQQAQSQLLALEKERSGLVKDESVKKQRLELLLSTSSRERKYSNLLIYIATLVPQELWINQFDINESEIQISGTTLNPQLIIQFMDQLDKSGAFTNSHFASSEKQVIETHTVHNFQITTDPVWDVIQKKSG